MSIYFDNSATTQVRKEVADAMVDFITSNYGNPSSSHSFGRQSRSIIETSRKGVRHLVPDEKARRRG